MFKTRDGSPVWGLAILMLIGLLVLAAACNGNGGDGDDSDTREAGETPADMADGGDEGDGDADGDQDGEADGEADGSGSALEDYFGEWAETEGQISYEYTSEGGGTSDSGTFTLYWMPPSWRWDGGDDDSQSIIISTASDYYLCSEDSCLSYGSLGEIPPPVPFFGLFTDPGAVETSFGGALGVDLDTSDETIAGVSASCFSASSEAGGEAAGGEWCWADENGLLLRVRAVSTSGGEEYSYEFEATEVGDVSAGDFEPPYPVQDLGDLIPDDLEIPGQ